MSKKFSLLKEPTSSLFAYTHRRPRLAERTLIVYKYCPRHFLLSVSERLYAKRKAMRHMCKQTVTQHLAKRDSRLPAYGSVVLQIFYFMKAFTRKNEFVMSYYFLFIIAQNIFNYCLLYSQRIERSMFLLNCLLFPIILLHRIP